MYLIYQSAKHIAKITSNFQINTEKSSNMDENNIPIGKGILQYFKDLPACSFD